MNNVVSELLSIEEIVKDNFFKIPDYQRGYSWEESQLTDLIKDIDHIATITHKHYTGTIVITENKDTKKYEVVDGQQRLTTIIVLLKLIYDTDPIKYAQIKENFIVRNDGEYVLETNAETNIYFKEAVLGNKKSLPDEIKSITNLKFAKEFFSEWLKTNEHRIDEIYQTVINRLGFICFSPTNTNEIGIMFEVINNRGKALSELEKIKNYFIYYATINSRNGLRNKINDNWGSILKYLSQAYVTSNEEEDKFLRNCYLVFFSANKGRSWYVYQELKEKYKAEDKIDIDKKVIEIEGFIDFIQQAAQFYSYFFNGDFFKIDYKQEFKDTLDTALKRLRCHPVNASILPLYLATMTYLYERPNDVIEMLDLIEKVNFRIYVLLNKNIARSDSRQGDLFTWAWRLYQERNWHSDNFPDEITIWNGQKIQGDIFTLISSLLIAFTSALCPEEVFVQSLTIDNDETAVNFYHWNGLRFFLASYEEQLNRKKRKETWDIEKILITRDKATGDQANDYLSREHIWASENRANDFPWNWKEKRRLGNFVLLGMTSNIQLQKEDIKDKIDFMIEKSLISMMQVEELKKFCENATKVASERRERKTKYYYLYQVISLVDQRENELIKFALERWKLPKEKLNRFIKIDVFEANKLGQNHNYFLKEK
jgi:uncharacterized protein with ParB-like and HNH nuclease domain